jgi:secondary thiamine-phosphate synthase enzyme
LTVVPSHYARIIERPIYFAPGVLSRPDESMERIEVRTQWREEVVDVTQRVQEAVRATGVLEGIAVVQSPHTTTAIVVNEREGGLVQDILGWASKMAPSGAGYHHDGTDGNAHAHLRSVMMGTSVAIPISGGRLALGTWQSVLFVEMDGPRSRQVHIQVVGG